ncbi:alpha/beta fold hydrolase [Natronococcus occultus]|uniref:Putative hydrolase or acyltransferase of alpha/beta superfamily n=1 Tax=Natronococcus occultus SP4 TaxID=694430 RepID=L0K6S3_9EURY|nr:alpha/beta hydrolase [Natronococcus occultus]AGB39808.1 putative hydrolase or acyltransferase of alpha/beta superfamily [Natronococcus occultus SP4]
MDKPTQSNPDEEIHRAVSDDGTEIAGRVHGEGPPLVLVHGAMGDGEFVWDQLLPFLTDRFTCYTMSMRSRGLSGHSADLSTERRIQDVTAFVENVGEPVGLLGWSQGGQLALGAAERTDAVSALAAYEPAVVEAINEEEFAQFTDTITRVSELVAEDRPADAARTFIEWVSTEDEMDEMDDAMIADFVEGCAANVHLFLQEVEELNKEEKTSPTEASELAKIAAPVLLLQGGQSDPWFIDGNHHVAEHVTDSQVSKIDGTGHTGPIHTPEAVADEVRQFFTAAPEPPRS